MTKSDNKRQLSDKQFRAITLIVSGKNDSEVAKTLNVTRQTVNKWKNKEHRFVAELNYQRKEVWDSHVDYLRSLLPKAVEILVKELNSEDLKISKDAARFILSKIILMPTGKVIPAEVEMEMLENASKADPARAALLRSYGQF
jgi:transposase